MRIKSLVSIGLGALALSLTAAAQGPANLDTVLHQLDDASKNFRSAQADFRWDVYEKVVDETSSQCGVIYFERKNGGTEMGAKVAPSLTQSCNGEAAATANGTKTLQYKAGELQMFEPKTDHLTILRAGNNQALYESFLTLGFGGSGQDLAKAWNITDQGTVVLKDGPRSVTTTKLDLIAKDAANRKTFSHVTIWIDPIEGVSLKQQFFAPDGDYRTTYFDHIRVNQKVKEAAFAIKTDKKTQVDRR
jgi:hypothetical protein